MQTEQQVLIILTPGFPENEADSSCLPAQQQLVKAMNKNHPSIKIIIISFQYPFNAISYDWYGNRVISFGGNNHGGLARLLLWRKIGKQLIKLNRENELIGILSFWCGECALLGHRFAKKLKLKHYCWILGQDARMPNRYVKRIKPAAEELAAMSDFLQAEFYRNHHIQPHKVITNGVTPAEYASPIPNKYIDLIGVGSLIPLKQFEIFIETVAVLQIAFPGIRAVICGKGPEQKRLQEWIDMYGLGGSVKLLGELPYPEVLKLMQRSRILLHPSSYEGFSSVCLEALGASARVISFCKPMQRDIENWHIVDSKESMVEKATELLKLPNAEPTFPFLMEDVAREMMGLFSDKQT